MKGLFVCCVALLACSHVSADTILHEERSLYSNVIVKEYGGLTCLQFLVKRQQRNQSCMDNKNPRRMVFAYIQMSMTSLLFVPVPTRILVVGLGGGTLPMAFNELFPQAHIDAIEIDPVVVKVAKHYFKFEPNEQLRVHEQDARFWTRRATRNPERYDIIVLDAFNGEYIPEHLMTQEFFSELKSLLSPRGVFIANTFEISALYDHESVTYAAVFGDFINFKIPSSSNRVVIAPNQFVPDETLKSRAALMAPMLRPYGVPIQKFAAKIAKQRGRPGDWDSNARILTDEYSPANLLKQRR